MPIASRAGSRKFMGLLTFAFMLEWLHRLKGKLRFDPTFRRSKKSPAKSGAFLDNA